MQPVTLSLRIERKQDDLPRYVVVPSKAIAAGSWRNDRAGRVADGSPGDRRTIKPWGTRSGS
jgi:hypothetical protein